MKTIRSAKTKGSQFEYSVYDSLKTQYPNILLTKQLGFVQQYDLIDYDAKMVIECKRLKGFSWNGLLRIFYKLCDKALKISTETMDGYVPFLIFKGNFQPCLVMHFDSDHNICVHEFQTYFGVPFLDRQNNNKVVTLSDNTTGHKTEDGGNIYISKDIDKLDMDKSA